MVEGKMQITVEAKSMSFRLEFKLNLYTSKLGKLSDPPRLYYEILFEKTKPCLPSSPCVLCAH